MKEPYSEGIAPCTDPESCTDGSNVGGEALAGANTGQPLSGEIDSSGMPTLLSEAEGNTGGDAKREPPSDPAPSETLSTCGNSMNGNREVPRIPSPGGGDGRSGKAKCHTPDMHVLGKSDGCVVPEKLPNKGWEAQSAEVVEGRRPRPGRRAGNTCRPDCNVCEEWQERIRMHGSPHYCIM